MPISIEVLGPLAAALDRVIGATVSPSPAGAGAAALGSSSCPLAATTAGGFGPLELAAAVATAAPSNVTATVDAGAHFLAVMPFWPATAPMQLLISNGLATMGFALPAAIGAALARPDSPVVCMVGDGGLAMTLAELETVARLRLPITVVVFDDAALSLIEVKQKPGQGGSDAVRFQTVDYAAVAAAMGLDSVVVTTSTEAAAALTAGWDRPRVIDARIDPVDLRIADHGHPWLTDSDARDQLQHLDGRAHGVGTLWVLRGLATSAGQRATAPGVAGGERCGDRSR